MKSSKITTDEAQSIILVMGPTASGKTDLAINIAKACDWEIINGDAMQIYSEIPIITAQPTLEEKRSIPHHLFGYKLGSEPCSVADWLVETRHKISEIHKRNKVPIIVGGSGMYFKALTHGLSNIPNIEEAVRIYSRNLIQEIGKDEFYKLACTRDPRVSDNIKPGDSQRMIRAFEVIHQTGKSIFDWHDQFQSTMENHNNYLQIHLDIPRNILYEKINKRFHIMVESGALEEAKLIMEKYDDHPYSINKAHGIPELKNYLKGTCSKDQAIERAQIVTRQYAKRQVTWLRHQMNDLQKIIYRSPEDFQAIIKIL